jgi:hypothetical protein
VHPRFWGSVANILRPAYAQKSGAAFADRGLKRIGRARGRVISILIYSDY